MWSACIDPIELLIQCLFCFSIYLAWRKVSYQRKVANKRKVLTIYHQLYLGVLIETSFSIFKVCLFHTRFVCASGACILSLCVC